MELQESQKLWMKVVAKVWSDKAFKARLLADPAAVLKEHGIEVPTEMAVKVMEDTPKEVHLILPEQPAELSEAELDQLAAGAYTATIMTSSLPLSWMSKVAVTPIQLP
jgi:hypothetical protein